MTCQLIREISFRAEKLLAFAGRVFVPLLLDRGPTVNFCLLESRNTEYASSNERRSDQDRDTNWLAACLKLRPKLPSLKDFDNWVDIVVGAGEYRGNRFSTPIASTQKNVKIPTLRQQRNYGAPNSSA